ncbi:hypothetical protein C9J47_02345 [Photobacterium indicum]|uniref:Uncharacterized protein n=1 Tax=Photobacterium indicum TaxID=81447 RepID=A0A2T3LDI9_9GAMM|nr:hypothetical protein C9J47_02345 [Photobacterium indicum]
MLQLDTQSQQRTHTLIEEMITEISLSHSGPLIVISQQMAYDFGFEDASNFVKYFKNHTKQTRFT